MKYAILQAEPRGELERIGAAEQQRRIKHHQGRLNELMRERLAARRPGLIHASAGLGPFHGGTGETITVRNRGGTPLRVDGPFPETKEVLGGFNIIDFDSRQEAIEFAKSEHIHESHVSELRPIRELWWVAQTLGAAGSQVFMLASIVDEDALMRLPESERRERVRAHQAVGTEYAARRGMLDRAPGLWVGARLSPAAEATTIRWTGGGRHVSDGPFAETKEVIGGFHLIACRAIDEAVEWAEKLAARAGDAIEVRPVDGGCWWIYHE
jgi:hypothetical protein